jgi:hypothetical protein
MITSVLEELSVSAAGMKIRVENIRRTASGTHDVILHFGESDSDSDTKGSSGKCNINEAKNLLRNSVNEKWICRYMPESYQRNICIAQEKRPYFVLPGRFFVLIIIFPKDILSFREALSRRSGSPRNVPPRRPAMRHRSYSRW